MVSSVASFDVNFGTAYLMHGQIMFGSAEWPPFGE